jgi:hypothetical protein
MAVVATDGVGAVMTAIVEVGTTRTDAGADAGTTVATVVGATGVTATWAMPKVAPSTWPVFMALKKTR